MVAVEHDLTLASARQVKVAREHVTGIDIALAVIPLALRPACVIIAIALAMVCMRAARIARVGIEGSRVIVSVAGGLGLAPVVIAIERVGAVAAVAVSVKVESIIVAGVIARVEIKHRVSLSPWTPSSC